MALFFYLLPIPPLCRFCVSSPLVLFMLLCGLLFPYLHGCFSTARCFVVSLSFSFSALVSVLVLACAVVFLRFPAILLHLGRYLAVSVFWSFAFSPFLLGRFPFLVPVYLRPALSVAFYSVALHLRVAWISFPPAACRSCFLAAVILRCLFRPFLPPSRLCVFLRLAPGSVIDFFWTSLLLPSLVDLSRPSFSMSRIPALP